MGKWEMGVKRKMRKPSFERRWREAPEDRVARRAKISPSSRIYFGIPKSSKMTNEKKKLSPQATPLGYALCTVHFRLSLSILNFTINNFDVCYRKFLLDISTGGGGIVFRNSGGI